MRLEYIYIYIYRYTLTHTHIYIYIYIYICIYISICNTERKRKIEIAGSGRSRCLPSSGVLPPAALCPCLDPAHLDERAGLPKETIISARKGPLINSRKTTVETAPFRSVLQPVRDPPGGGLACIPCDVDRASGFSYKVDRGNRGIYTIFFLSLSI